jgi:nucleolar complex protein 2
LVVVARQATYIFLFSARLDFFPGHQAPRRLALNTDDEHAHDHSMGRVKKSTRKFESKHLKRTLDDRNENKKLKQQYILREKKKKRQSAHEPHDDSDNEDAEKPKPKKAKTAGLGELEGMSVEQFFQGGFEVPEAGKSKKGGKSKGGKRKRDEVEEKPKTVEEEGNADEDDGDEVAQHKQDLGDLAEQDPEFYKYLKENDPELLDFSMAEKDDLASIDELSESEDEVSGRKKRKSKKGLNESDEVTMADVKKWKQAMVDRKSLRSLRQVVLAFRAAAHANDAEDDAKQGGYKYSVTSPDGTFFQSPIVLFPVTRQLTQDRSVPRACASRVEACSRSVAAPSSYQRVSNGQDVSEAIIHR